MPLAAKQWLDRRRFGPSVSEADDADGDNHERGDHDQQLLRQEAGHQDTHAEEYGAKRDKVRVSSQ